MHTYEIDDIDVALNGIEANAFNWIKFRSRDIEGNLMGPYFIVAD